MITVTKTSREFNEVETYLMTIAPGVKSVKDVEDGEKITVDGWLEFEDEKDNGDVTSVLSVITPDKKVFACQSQTFKRSLKDIAGIMKSFPFTIVKTSGKTKAGRDFVNCELDVSTIL